MRTMKAIGTMVSVFDPLVLAVAVSVARNMAFPYPGFEAFGAPCTLQLGLFCVITL